MVSFTPGFGALNCPLAALGLWGRAQGPKVAVEACSGAQWLFQSPLRQQEGSRRHPLWIAGPGAILAAFGRALVLICKAASATSQQQTLPDLMWFGVSKRRLGAAASRRRIAQYF